MSAHVSFVIIPILIIGIIFIPFGVYQLFQWADNAKKNHQNAPYWFSVWFVSVVTMVTFLLGLLIVLTTVFN